MTLPIGVVFLVQPTDKDTADGRPSFEVIDGHRRITVLKHIVAEFRRENGTIEPA